MNGSEKQVKFANSIVSEFNESVTTGKNKQNARIEKMIAKDKDPKDFICRNEEPNYWTNMIVSIVTECSNAGKIIESKDEILKAGKDIGSSASWANLAFLVGGMSRTEINNDKYTFIAGE